MPELHLGLSFGETAYTWRVDPDIGTFVLHYDVIVLDLDSRNDGTTQLRRLQHGSYHAAAAFRVGHRAGSDLSRMSSPSTWIGTGRS